jgi:hypothetical protein
MRPHCGGQRRTALRELLNARRFLAAAQQLRAPRDNPSNAGDDYRQAERKEWSENKDQLRGRSVRVKIERSKEPGGGKERCHSYGE